jgi:uncharacterized protein (DUF1800 family)
MAEADFGGHRHRAAPEGAGASGMPAVIGNGRPALLWLIRNRRQVLMSLGIGGVAAAGLGSTVALFAKGDPLAAVADGMSPKRAGSFSDRDASYTIGMGDGAGLGAQGIEETPAKAAAKAATMAPRDPNPLRRDPILHLLRRTTFGPTPSTVEQARKMGIDAWLDTQLQPEAMDDALADAMLANFPTVKMSTPELHVAVKNESYTAMTELGQSTIGRQIWSNRQLYEVMVDFWANHFNVTNPFDGGWDTRSVFDKDAIRPHALGRFSEMLAATARGPAMLRYLNNDLSDKKAVNENYGRELLELHTVAIDSGYTETDVRNSAYLMTGRTVGSNGLYQYNAKKHWVGPVKILGFTHANANAAGGEQAGEEYVNYLATHPATANHLARKLAVRFVCDSPPQALIDRLAKSYLDNGTAIVPVLRTLFRSLEFWIATGLKTRRPLENVVATARVLGVQPGTKPATALDSLHYLVSQLGNAPFGWAEPDGYADVATAWSSAAGMLGVWNAHRTLVQGGISGFGFTKPEQLLPAVPATVGGYLDGLAQRLLFQPLSAAQRQTLLTFLGVADNAPTKNPTLDGKLQHLAPLFLDSIYHALR